MAKILKLAERSQPNIYLCHIYVLAIKNREREDGKKKDEPVKSAPFEELARDPTQHPVFILLVTPKWNETVIQCSTQQYRVSVTVKRGQRVIE